MIIKKYTKEETELARKIILENELYNAPNSWRSAFWAFAQANTFSQCIEEFVVAFIEDKPIGIAFRLHGYGMYGARVTCYVKPEYRRQKIGSMLVNQFNTASYNNPQFPEGFPKHE